METEASAFDRRQIDDLTAALYAAFDTRDGRVPALSRLERLFIPQALIVKNVDRECVVYDLPSFIAPRRTLLTSGEVLDFNEWEVEATTHVEGTIAQRLSRYKKRWRSAGRAFEGSGIKTLQFVRLRERWAIASLVWDDEPSTDAPE